MSRAADSPQSDIFLVDVTDLKQTTPSPFLYRNPSSHSATTVHSDGLQASMSRAADSPQSDIFLVDVTDLKQTTPSPLQVCIPFCAYIRTGPDSYASVNSA